MPSALKALPASLVGLTRAAEMFLPSRSKVREAVSALAPASCIAVVSSENFSGVVPTAAAMLRVFSPSSPISLANSVSRSTANATPRISAIVPSPPTAPVSGATIPSSASLTPLMPRAASSCAALWSRNAAVRLTTLDLALLN